MGPRLAPGDLPAVPRRTEGCASILERHAEVSSRHRRWVAASEDPNGLLEGADAIDHEGEAPLLSSLMAICN